MKTVPAYKLPIVNPESFADLIGALRTAAHYNFRLALDCGDDFAGVCARDAFRAARAFVQIERDSEPVKVSVAFAKKGGLI